MHRPTLARAAGALAAAAAIALPLGMALPAHATTSNGCTVTPLKPVFAGFNSSGVKLLDYKISVTCSADRTANITQKRYDQDWPDADDLLGTSTFTRSFGSSGGSTTISNVRTVVDTDPFDAYEEDYQQVHFSVTSNGVTSPYTSYQSSAVLSIHV